MKPVTHWNPILVTKACQHIPMSAQGVLNDVDTLKKEKKSHIADVRVWKMGKSFLTAHSKVSLWHIYFFFHAILTTRFLFKVPTFINQKIDPSSISGKSDTACKLLYLLSRKFCELSLGDYSSRVLKVHSHSLAHQHNF